MQGGNRFARRGGYDAGFVVEVEGRKERLQDARGRRGGMREAREAVPFPYAIIASDLETAFFHEGLKSLETSIERAAIYAGDGRILNGGKGDG